MEKLHTSVSIEQLQGMMADLILSQRVQRDNLKATDKLLSEKFQATDKKFQATDKKFQAAEKLLTDKFKATEKLFKETGERFDKISAELGGIGNSNGAVAEDFFRNALSNSLKVNNMTFDYIDFNLHRKKKNTEAEYDIILYNHYKILIVEVKYNFKRKKLRTFYDGLKKFRSLYPEYSSLKLYGAVAALTYDEDTIEEAQNYGFFVLSQNNDKLKLTNPKGFQPNEIK